MKSWSLSTQKDEGWTIVLYEDLSLRKEAVGWAWDNLCHLTNGWIGGHGLPEIFWKIPLGKPDRDDNCDILNNSIALKLMDLENWVYKVTSQENKKLAKCPISVKVARQLDPDFVAIFEGDDEGGE